MAAMDEIDDGVWVGMFTPSQRRAPLRNACITHIVNCTHNFPCKFPEEIEYLQLHLADQTGEVLL